MNIINAVSGTGITQTADGSGLIKVQSNGVTTNALAWVNFAGSTGTIKASYNVSSITRSGTGQYTLNFANALNDANYSANVTLNGGNAYIGTTSVFSTTSLAIYGFTTASAFYDSSNVCVSIFGN